MKKRGWIYHRDAKVSVWRQVVIALLDVVDGIVNLVLAPFGYGVSISFSFVVWINRREALKAGVNVDLW